MEVDSIGTNASTIVMVSALRGSSNPKSVHIRQQTYALSRRGDLTPAEKEAMYKDRLNRSLKRSLNRVFYLCEGGAVLE